MPCPRPPSGAALRLRQERARRIRARARRAGRRTAVDRRHRQGRSRRRDFRSPRSRVHRLSRKCSTAASRRCIPRFTAAFSRGATFAEHVDALDRARHSADRPGRRQPVSVPRDGRAAPVARSTMRSRTSTSAARRWCARRRRTMPTSASSSIPPTIPRCSTSCESTGGTLDHATRFALAQKAFSHTAAYDGAISNYLTARDECGRCAGVSRPLQLAGKQGAGPALRRESAPAGGVLSRRDARAGNASPTARQLQGKELSYNNIADSDAAWECVRDFSGRACVIVKHANPCGVAVRGDAARGLSQRASRPIPTSAFGGIIAFNREVDAATVEAVSAQFLEVLIAPSYTPDALARDRQEGQRARARRSSSRDGSGSALGRASASAAACSSRRRRRRVDAASLKIVTRKRADAGSGR